MDFLSPAVKSREIDKSFYATGTASSVYGCIGAAQRGPINTPVLITSISEFVDTFGEPVIADYGPLAAISFLKTGSQLYYIRVASSGIKKASKLYDSVIKISAKEEGSYANSYYFTVTNVKDKEFKLSLFVNGINVEEFDATLDVDAENFLENLESDYVDFDVIESAVKTKPDTWPFVEDYQLLNASSGVYKYTKTNLETGEITSQEYTLAAFATPGTPGASVSATTLATQADITVDTPDASTLQTVTDPSKVFAYIHETVDSEYLAEGADGLPVNAEAVIGKAGTTNGIQAFYDKDSYPITFVSAPGHYEVAVLTELINLCETRTDCIAICGVPQGLNYKDAVLFINGEYKGTEYAESKYNTSYAAFYYPWVKQYNNYSGKYEWNPPEGNVAGVYAQNDELGQLWFAPAGLNRGELKLVTALETDLTLSQRDHLYSNNVNALINYKKQGYYVWGQKTSQRKTTALDRVNVRRLMASIRKNITTFADNLLFEQNTEILWNSFTAYTDPYLENIKNAQGLYDYKVVMDSSINTPTTIDQNRLFGRIYVQPTKTAEFIQLDFVITPTGADFTEYA